MNDVSNRIDLFLMVNSKNFETTQILDIKQRLSQFNEHQWNMIMTTQFKDPYIFLLISILGGTLGIDRFMLGDVGLGIAKLLTCGGFGIWHIIDLFIIMANTRDHNYAKFLEIAQLNYSY